MASNAGRVPAWRKLGLALKNNDQSQPSVPVARTTDNISERTSHTAAGNSSLALLQPAKNVTLSSLGKQKRQRDLADEAGEAAKKGRPSPSVDEISIASTTETFNVTNSKIEKPGSNLEVAFKEQTTTLKGDPNYRKKTKAVKTQKRRVEKESRGIALPRSTISSDEDDSVRQSAMILASTEIDHSGFIKESTPQPQSSRIKSDSTTSSPSGRRKRVTFTPDTKTIDGSSSGHNLSKKWAAPDGVQPTSDPNTNIATTKSEHQPLSAQTPIPTQEVQRTSFPNSIKAGVSKRKKKDTLIYLDYLTQYYSNRKNWKFNKARQNVLIDNALNIFRIPAEYDEALIEYISGLKGAGVITRLKENCEATIRDLDEQDTQSLPTMNDTEAQKIAKEEALQGLISKERKRRKVEGDITTLTDHPNPEGFIRRMRRQRAEALLTALARTGLVLPITSPQSGINPMVKFVAPQRDSKKRKRRGEASSSESSCDSSSDSSSEGDSSASDSASDKDSSSNSDSSSDSKISPSPGGRKSDDESSGNSSDSDESGSSNSESDSD